MRQGNQIFPEPLTVFDLELARGNIANHSGINKFGKNPDVDIGTEDVWSQGGTWVPPTTARIHDIVSTNANDTAAGSGLRTITVYGLDSSYAEISETVSMAGLVNAPTVNSYTIIHRMIGSTGAANIGTITATAQTDATVTIAILPGKGQSQLCIYQIPSGYSGYVYSFSGAMDGSATASVDVELFIKPFGGIYNFKGTLMLSGGGSSSNTYNYTIPIKVNEKSIIKATATSDTNNIDVTAWFEMILVKN